MSAAQRQPSIFPASFFASLVSRVEKMRWLPWPLLPFVRQVPQLSAYSLASAAALSLDLGIYFSLAHSGYRPAIAGVIGYALGTVLHFVLSSRFVFDREGTKKSESRLFSEFALASIAGLAVTAAVIAIATDIAGMSIFSAKLCAVALSFMVVYVLRRHVVFVERPSRAG